MATTRKPAAKKPAAKKPAAKKPAAKKPILDLDDPQIVPKLFELAQQQEVERQARAEREALKGAKPLRCEVAIRPTSEPPWGYSFSLDEALPAEERASLKAFFSRFTRLDDNYAVAVFDRSTPAETRRSVWDSNRLWIEVEQLRAHLPSDDVTVRTERLKRVLATPSYDMWFELVMLLSTWDEATLADAIAVAEEGLARWPDAARYEMSVWKDRPALMRLARTAAGAMSEVLQRPLLEAATVLSTQDAAGLEEHQASLSHIRELSLSGSVGVDVVAIGCTALPKLRALELQQPTYSNGTRNIDLKKLLKAPHLSDLDALSLYGFTFKGKSLDALAACAQPLTRLRIEYGKMQPADAAPLATLASRKRLTSLQLKYNDLGPEGAQTLFARADDWTSLRVLDISANEIGDRGTVALARANLKALRWLSISSNDPKEQLTARAAVALAEAPSLGNLEGLFLMGHPVGTDGVAALLQSPTLRGLKRLNVSFASASIAELVKRVGESETVALTELAIGNNDTSKKVDWTRASFLRTVRSLGLDSLDGRNYEGFFACPHLEALEVLVLGGCYANNDKGFAALSRAPRIPSLRYVDLSGWKLDEAKARELVKAPFFEGVWGVQVLPSYVTPEAWRAFYEAGVPLVNGGFNRFPANEVGSLTTFRDEV